MDEPANKKKKNVEEYNKYLKAYLAYIHNVYELSNYPVLIENQKKKEVSSAKILFVLFRFLNNYILIF